MIALLMLAGCAPHQQQRDFVYGPPEAIARTHQAALDCGIASATVKALGKTAILQIDLATPQSTQTCLQNWIATRERDVRVPPKL